jgi:phospholipid/cholesterol/gamma-HCH transport system substrate-binding protein
MKISKETKVGILVAIAITILAVGYNFMKGKDVFTTTNEYFGVYNQIEGLFKSNPVLINGYKVGSVSSVEMNKETLELTVGIAISEDIKIPKNSIMKIVNIDMIGSKAIEIIFGDSKEIAQNGDFFTSEQDKGIAQAVSGVLSPLSERVNSVLGSMDTAISGVDIQGTLIDASKALRSFKETADKLNKLLDGKEEKINGILSNIELSTVGIASATPKLNGILENLDQTSSKLNEVDFKHLADQLDTLSVELSKTTQSINNKKGSLGMLVHDKTLYHKLDSSISNLNALLKDVEKYPRRYTGFTERQRKKGDQLKEEN